MQHRQSGDSSLSRPAALSLNDQAIYAGVLITRAQMIEQCRANGLPETGFGVDWFAFGPPFERHRIADEDLTREQFPFGLLVYVAPNAQEIRVFPALSLDQLQGTPERTQRQRGKNTRTCRTF